MSLLKRETLLGLMTFGFTLVVIELMCQLAYFVTAGDFLFRRTLPPIYVNDPVRCYGVQPNLDYLHHANEFKIHVYTNSVGMRTDASHREFPLEKPADHYRVLVLGPSFAFGWGSDYEDIFPTLLEQRLKVPGKTLEVLNIGTPSQGPDHQLCWLEQVGRRYSPDLVLQVAYGTPVPPMPARCPEELKCPVVENGLLYTGNPSLTRRAIAFVKNFGTVFYGYYLYQLLLPSDSGGDEGKELYVAPKAAIPEGDHDALAKSYFDLVHFAQRAAGDDVAVAFLYIPYGYVVHPGDAPRYRHIHAMDPQQARHEITEQIAGLRARGVSIVDTTPLLIAGAEHERQYYWLDIHLTPAGNASVADAATGELQSLIDRPR